MVVFFIIELPGRFRFPGQIGLQGLVFGFRFRFPGSGWDQVSGFQVQVSGSGSRFRLGSGFRFPGVEV